MDRDFNFQQAFEGIHERLNEISTGQTEAKTHLKGLLGNGQPGRITLIEADVDNLKLDRARLKGYIGGIGAVVVALGWAGHIFIDYFLPTLGVVHK